MNTLFTKWPGPHTWLIPPTATTPSWLQGKSGSVAVRLSTHPTVINITQELGSSICSTSANLSGNEPAKNPNEIKKYLARIYSLLKERWENLINLLLSKI